LSDKVKDMHHYVKMLGLWGIVKPEENVIGFETDDQNF